MARAHDGLMMLLTVGRNHALRLVVFYDRWLSLMIIVISSMMDVISFMLDGCIMYVMVSFTWLHLYHGFYKVDLSLSCICILFKIFIPYDMYNGWLNIPNQFAKMHLDQMYNVDIRQSNLFFHVDVVVVRLSLIKLNVTQCPGILKECNLLGMLYMIIC